MVYRDKRCFKSYFNSTRRQILKPFKQPQVIINHESHRQFVQFFAFVSYITRKVLSGSTLCVPSK